MGRKLLFFLCVLPCFLQFLSAAEFSNAGQVTGWLNLPEQEKAGSGLRYIPEFFWSAPEYALDIDLARKSFRRAGQVAQNSRVLRLWLADMVIHQDRDFWRGRRARA